MEGRVSSVQSMGAVDGPGLRHVAGFYAVAVVKHLLEVHVGVETVEYDPGDFDAGDDAFLLAKQAHAAGVARKLPLAEGLATYPTEEELLTEALLGAENTGRDVQLFMNRMEHDDYRSVPELYQARCPECGAPLQNDEVWLKRGNTGYFTRAACPYCGHWYLRFKLSRRDGLHWSFARCIDPATPEYDAKWDKQKAALLERMKRKQERNIKE